MKKLWVVFYGFILYLTLIVASIEPFQYPSKELPRGWYLDQNGVPQRGYLVRGGRIIPPSETPSLQPRISGSTTSPSQGMITQGTISQGAGSQIGGFSAGGFNAGGFGATGFGQEISLPILAAKMDRLANELSGQQTAYDFNGQVFNQSQDSKGWHRAIGNVKLDNGRAVVAITAHGSGIHNDVSFASNATYQGQAWSLDTTNANVYQIYPLSNDSAIMVSNKIEIESDTLTQINPTEFYAYPILDSFGDPTGDSVYISDSSITTHLNTLIANMNQVITSFKALIKKDTLDTATVNVILEGL
jgi:hypothetical protein